jgi:hypothetical protein
MLFLSVPFLGCFSMRFTIGILLATSCWVFAASDEPECVYLRTSQGCFPSWSQTSWQSCAVVEVNPGDYACDPDVFVEKGDDYSIDFDLWETSDGVTGPTGSDGREVGSVNGEFYECATAGFCTLDLSHDEFGNPTGGTCVKSEEATFTKDKVIVTTVVCSYGTGEGCDDGEGY